MIKLLLAEDEQILGALIAEALKSKSFEVSWARNGQEALHLFRTQRPQIAVLDVMMPVMDGFTVAKEIRMIDEEVPLLFLTARSETADVVKGFESGGNDYLKKPFSLEELVVRLHELLRRNGQKAASGKEVQEAAYTLGSFTFDATAQVLTRGDETTQLSYREAGLLLELLHHKNEILERKSVLLKLWGDDSLFNARNMDVYIARLRKYLSADEGISILNIRGIGFKLLERKTGSS